MVDGLLHIYQAGSLTNKTDEVNLYGATDKYDKFQVGLENFNLPRGWACHFLTFWIQAKARGETKIYLGNLLHIDQATTIQEFCF